MSGERRYKRTPGKHVGGPFRPGNSVAVGHDGSSKNHRVLTQTLISALNEADPKCPKGRMYALVDKLLKLAIGDSDLDAIRYVFDRVDGKMLSATSREGDAGDDEPFAFTLRIGRALADGTRAEIEEINLRTPGEER